jgi:glycosyl-4,4'-diaponeurosporenoate acyltransferase
VTLPLLVDLSPVATLLANVVACAGVHAGTGYAVHRLPPPRLQHDGWLLRARRVEGAGGLYAKRLHIARWKDHLPEAGALFAGGISKRHVTRDLDRFVAETRRAEYGHWLALACWPVFALWNPPVGVVLMVLYSVLVNAPFIAIQRYNRQRAQRVLARRGDQARSERSRGSEVAVRDGAGSRTSGSSIP